MILRAIAFDTEDEATRFVRIRYRQIDEKAGGPNLRLHVVTERRQSRRDLFFEDRIWVSARFFSDAKPAGLRKGEEHLECRDTPALRTRQIDVVSSDRREHFTPELSARDQHVKTALAAIRIEGAEAHRDIPFLCPAVSQGYKDDVSFIALDILEVLYEEGFGGSTAEEFLRLGILLSE